MPLHSLDYCQLACTYCANAGDATARLEVSFARDQNRLLQSSFSQAMQRSAACRTLTWHFTQKTSLSWPYAQPEDKIMSDKVQFMTSCAQQEDETMPDDVHLIREVQALRSRRLLRTLAVVQDFSDALMAVNDITGDLLMLSECLRLLHWFMSMLC